MVKFGNSYVSFALIHTFYKTPNHPNFPVQNFLASSLSHYYSQLPTIFLFSATKQFSGKERKKGMAVAAKGRATELQIPKKWRDRSESSPERTKVWTEPPKLKTTEKRSVPVVYYLSRNGQLEHPHFMEVPLSSPESGLYLRGNFIFYFLFFLVNLFVLLLRKLR
jgi:hypothetical protein